MDHRPANGDDGVDRAEHRPNGAQAADNAEPSLSLEDRTLADRDQAHSVRDQQAYEDDQPAAGFHGGDPEAYQLTAAARAETPQGRATTSSRGARGRV